MNRIRVCTALTLAFVTACKPSDPDAVLRRDLPEPAPTFASAPLDSPNTDGAVWVASGGEERIVYGVPGERALMALECIRSDDADAALRITRFAPADRNAQALMALIGNGHMGRLPVDAVETNSDRIVWRGTHEAQAAFWDPLAGPRALAATVPGAGRVALNASPLPMQVVRDCRTASGDAARDR